MAVGAIIGALVRARLRAKRGFADPSAAARSANTILPALRATRPCQSRIIASDAITDERRGLCEPGYAGGFARCEFCWTKLFRRVTRPWRFPCARLLAQGGRGTGPPPARRQHPQVPGFQPGPARTSPSAAFAVWTQRHIRPRCISLLEANNCARERKLAQPPAELRRVPLPVSARS